MAYASHSPNHNPARSAGSSVFSALKWVSDRIVENRQRKAAEIIRQTEADLGQSWPYSGLERSRIAQDPKGFRYYF